jgi:hypothetical protein
MSGPVPEWARHEVKFAAPETVYADLRGWVHVHSAGFHSPYPPRQVNNVYFDNPELFAYEENLVGASWRSKLRMRWYGDTFRPESTTIEVKRRRNLVGWKLSFPGGAVDLESETWLEIRRKLRAKLPAAARIWLDANPQPVLSNRYAREYFESRDGRVRVTLDREQCVLDQRFKARPNLTAKANLPATMIVEFKFAQKDRALASQAIQGLPIRVSKNSKYVIGVQSLVGP